MLIWLIVVSLFFVISFRFVFFRQEKGFAKSLKHVMGSLSNQDTDLSAVRALFVTAHPDDECMFFAPTIIQLVQFNASVNLLCLSEGNYYRQGSLRKEELLDSCAVLGIPGSKVSIIDHKNLPDDPNAQWSISLVSSVISKHIKMNSINLVLTFDGRGVSGHANHTAIYKAVRLLFVVIGDRWYDQKVPLSSGASPQLAAALIPLLYDRPGGLQTSQSCYALSSHSTTVVSLSVCHFFTLHVCEYFSHNPTRTKKSQSVLDLNFYLMFYQQCIALPIFLFLINYLKVNNAH